MTRAIRSSGCTPNTPCGSPGCLECDKHDILRDELLLDVAQRLQRAVAWIEPDVGARIEHPRFGVGRRLVSERVDGSGELDDLAPAAREQAEHEGERRNRGGPAPAIPQPDHISLGGGGLLLQRRDIGWRHGFRAPSWCKRKSVACAKRCGQAQHSAAQYCAGLRSGICATTRDRASKRAACACNTRARAVLHDI
ncbi:MAG: hypothetical protein HC863_01050 [Myxococcales bacterium]|nr:hypothetical protein [Myxococcales bacterium]